MKWILFASWLHFIMNNSSLALKRITGGKKMLSISQNYLLLASCMKSYFVALFIQCHYSYNLTFFFSVVSFESFVEDSVFQFFLLTKALWLSATKSYSGVLNVCIIFFLLVCFLYLKYVLMQVVLLLLIILSIVINARSIHECALRIDGALRFIFKYNDF